MNCKLDDSVKGRLIRDVGPNKMMTLISFKLTDEMVHRSDRKRQGSDIEELKNKQE